LRLQGGFIVLAISHRPIANPNPSFSARIRLKLNNFMNQPLKFGVGP